MANFRRGSAAITAAAEGGKSGGFVNNMSWKVDEKKYVQFLTGLEEMPTVLFHNFIITGIKKDGDAQYNNFVSRRDPALDGADGYDPILTRFGQKPSHRTLAVAAELVPEFREEKGRKRVTGVTLGTRTWKSKEGDVTEPGLYLINQSPGNFFGYLTSWEEDTGKSVSDVVWSITRRGSSKDTTYDMVEVSGVEPVDLSDVLDKAPDLDEYLSGLADEERIHTLIDPLPDDWKISKFAKNASAVSAPAPAATQSGDTPPWSEDDETPAPAARKSSFAALKAEVEGK
jgi:hypothetical protein